MIPGAPLEWLYTHPNYGFREEPFGGWQKALGEFAYGHYDTSQRQNFIARPPPVKAQ